MKMRKTWVSYLLWFIYAVTAGILLASYTAAVCTNLWELNKYATTAAVCVMFAGVAGVWLAGRKFMPYILGKLPSDEHFKNMWECFLAMSLFAAAILYRIHSIRYTAEAAVDKNIFYEMAEVTGGNVIPNITHGASYMYTVLLSAFFSLMGNKIIAGVVLQFVLQIAAMVFLFFALRLLAGRVAALAVIGCMAFAPITVREIFSLTPDVFYLFVYSAGLYLVSLYLNRWIRRGYQKKSTCVIFLITGIYIGMAAYLDMVGITLFFFAGMAMTAKKEDRVTGEKDIPPIVHFLIIAGSAIAAFLGLAAFDAGYSGQACLSVLQAWMEQYMNYAGLNFSFAEFLINPAMGIALGFFAAMLAVGFLFVKEQKTDSWILLFFSVIIINILGIGQLGYGVLIFIVWSVFAGLGFSSAVLLPEPKVEEQLEEQEEHRKGLNEMVIENLSLEEEESPVRFIENPLPLPRKHVKKEMDFSVNVLDEISEFDVSIDENDDFDI